MDPALTGFAGGFKPMAGACVGAKKGIGQGKENAKKHPFSAYFTRFGKSVTLSRENDAKAKRA
ncbi:MAG: hypothetical protein ACU0FH_22295 [Heliomarina sp.]|uniref:hypothetical protein n=1 Tax=Heliomarina sp. TaxID=2917556 RepID=UPI00405A48B3